MADRRSSRFHILSCALAFTMAEILISLTIIGIIAAITLPALQANINESSWKAQRKALYSRMSQAISMLPSLNGYGIGATETETTEKAAQTFLSDGLSKVLKINNICDYDNLKKCGIPDAMHNIDNTKNLYASDMTTLLDYNSAFDVNYLYTANNVTFSYSQINTKAAAFETVNGESVLVYYNPYCMSSDMGWSGAGASYAQRYLCANFVYDLNGKKGPNKMGKDIGFISALYPTDSVVIAPMPVAKDGRKVHEQALKYCNSQDKTTRMPNMEELMAIFYNRSLLNLVDDYCIYWTSNYSGDNATYVNPILGYINTNYPRNYYGFVRCIKR